MDRVGIDRRPRPHRKLDGAGLQQITEPLPLVPGLHRRRSAHRLGGSAYKASALPAELLGRVGTQCDKGLAVEPRGASNMTRLTVQSVGDLSAFISSFTRSLGACQQERSDRSRLRERRPRRLPLGPGGCPRRRVTRATARRSWPTCCRGAPASPAAARFACGSARPYRRSPGRRRPRRRWVRLRCRPASVPGTALSPAAGRTRSARSCAPGRRRIGPRPTGRTRRPSCRRPRRSEGPVAT